MRTARDRPSALGIIVLAMLHEEPMHPYRMQQLLQARGKDRVVNVRSRTSLYQTIERLVRLQLVEVAQTVRGERRPDRIIYALTDAGRVTARAWLADLLTSVGSDFAGFPAAVSVLTMLTPGEAADQLDRRVAAAGAELSATEAQLKAFDDLPPLFVLEETYRRTLLLAELAWLQHTVAQLRNGTLTWSDEWLDEMKAQHEKTTTNKECKS